MNKSRLILALLGGAALALGPLTVAPSMVGFDAAYAKNGGEGGKGGENGKGGEGGKGGENGKSGEAGGKKSGGESASSKGSSAGASGNSKAKSTATASVSKTKTNHGSIASQLKGLNAAHASAQAFASASPNSKVGQLRAYAEAYNAVGTAKSAAEAAAAEVLRLEALADTALADAFPDPVGYNQATYDAALAEAKATSNAAEVARLEGLVTPEQRAEVFPSTWDPDVARDAAVIEATKAQDLADAEVAAAEAAAQTALAAAGGANLDDAARSYLHDLLKDKVPAATTTPPADDEEVVGEVGVDEPAAGEGAGEEVAGTPVIIGE